METCDNYTKVKFKSKDILFLCIFIIMVIKAVFIFNQVGNCYIFSYIVS